jgi:ADP-dependent phosphofructokinase/glucokinase
MDRVIALANSRNAATRIDVVETMTSGLSQIISGSKKTVIAELNGLKSKYQKEIQNRTQLEEIKEAVEDAYNAD